MVEGIIVAYSDDNYNNKIAVFKSLENAKAFAKKNKRLYQTITFEDEHGDTIVVTNKDCNVDINWLFSHNIADDGYMAKGGKIKYPKYVFIRFGLPNKDENGYINSWKHVYGIKSAEEGGISVFEALKEGDKYYVYAQGSALKTSFEGLMLSNRDAYLVDGLLNRNEGADGDILLNAKDFVVIKKLDKSKIYDADKENKYYEDGGYMAKGGEFNISVKSTEELKELVLEEREKKIREWYKLGVRVVVGRNDGYWYETSLGETESISSTSPSNRKIIDIVKNNPNVTKIGFQGTIKAGSRVGQELEIVDDFSVILWERDGYMEKGGGVGFEPTEKLIDSIKKYGSKSIGTESTSSDGTKYRYDRYIVKEGSVHNWLVDLFEKAAKENGDRYATHFHYKDIYSIAYDRQKYKGTINGKIQMTELILYPTMSDGGYMAKGSIIDSEGGYASKRELNEDYKRIIKAPTSKNYYEENPDSLLGKIVEIKLPNEDKSFKTKVTSEYHSMVKGSGKYSKLYDKVNIISIKKDGGYMAKGGSISKFNPMELIGRTFWSKHNYGEIVDVRVLSEDNIKVKYETSKGTYSVEKSFTKKELFDMSNGKVINGDEILKMAKGGVTFADKVDAVKSSLLNRKKVAPAVQKDYGKTYSPKEAEDSAKRIVGSQVAKYKMK